jgi:predicted nuclease of predicted toxin-antitoxin system
MAIRFHLDEHIRLAVAQGLRRRGIDVTTTNDAGLQAAEDMHHLTMAQAQGRVIVTHDPDFLRLAAGGLQHSGIAFCASGTRTTAQLIEALELIHSCMTEQEMLNRIEYI